MPGEGYVIPSSPPAPSSGGSGSTDHVPFGTSELSRSAVVHAAESADLGASSACGPATIRVERLLAEGFGADSAFLTNSATSALEVLAVAFGELGYHRAIVPAFTHVSGASAFALLGYRIEFADIGEDLVVDPLSVAALEPDDRTVVLAVHYAGLGADVGALTEVCRPVGARVVDDLAHSFASRFDRPRPEHHGSAAVLSFQLQKEVTCGEGGAVLLFDSELQSSVREIRDRGTNRGEFEAGMVEHYSWVSHGSSYAPSELTATVLEAQIERCDAPIERRRQVLGRYVTALAGWAETTGVTLPVAAALAGAANTAYVVTASEEHRSSLAAHLAGRGVGSAIHFVPLHRSRMARRFGIAPDSCPTADRVFAGLLRLPLSSSLTDHQVDIVVDAVRTWRPPPADLVSRRDAGGGS